MFYSIPENVPLQLVYACLVMRMLYNIALDTYEKPNQNVVSFKSPSHKRQNIEVLVIIFHSFVLISTVTKTPSEVNKG